MGPVNSGSLEERIARLEETCARSSRGSTGTGSGRPGVCTEPRRRPAAFDACSVAAVEEHGMVACAGRGGAYLPRARTPLSVCGRAKLDNSAGARGDGHGFGCCAHVRGLADFRGAGKSCEDSIGLREVLLGSGLSAWYITAYAAAVSYHLISFSFARLIFLALSIGGAWLALSERRAVLALLAVGVGFSAPSAASVPKSIGTDIFALPRYSGRGWSAALPDARMAVDTVAHSDCVLVVCR